MIRRLFTQGWEFAKLPFGVSPEEAREQGCFQGVELPHDWLIGQVENLYETSAGWYRKRFSLRRQKEHHYLIRFDGVYMDTSVYVNGIHAGEWKYGYSVFTVDMTDWLRDGENVVEVEVRFREPNSRWYSGAGIFRKVWLVDQGEASLVPDGIYLTPRQEEGNLWKIGIGAEAACPKDTRELSLECVLVRLPDGEETGRREITVLQEDGEFLVREPSDEAAGKYNYIEGTAVRGVSVCRTPVQAELGNTAGLGWDQPAAENRDERILLRLQTSMQVDGPGLWSPEDPQRYQMKLLLKRGGEILDAERCTMGFRTVRMDPDEGFFLNGVRRKLNGVCEHHDFGALGAAFYEDACRRKFAILKKMGVNAVRSSHNMPAEDLMELADEMGLMIVSEAFDMWERPKTAYDYARFFPEWEARDVASWVRRDRNHPSLILWSIGNEIFDTQISPRGQEITRMLARQVVSHDPAGNAKPTIGSNYMLWKGAQCCADIVKTAGYNYGESLYAKHHEEHPDWVIYGSETASLVQSRGIYHFPLSQSLLSEDDCQCSSLGNSRTSWGGASAEAVVRMDAECPWSMGQFLWSGHDYIGEPTPYHTKNSYFGQIDTAGFPKDTYYIYQAGWTDYHTHPMVHVFPYWDFNPGQTVDIRVCSNCPETELFLNGVSLGRKPTGRGILADYRAAYAPGELRAVAYDEEGREVACESRHSFGDAAAIVLRAMRPGKIGSDPAAALVADGRSLLYVEISTVDAEGYPVENATNRVKISVEGAARLAGTDNGDSTDYDSYRSGSRRLFSGKLLAILQAAREPGKVRMEVTAPGLESASLEWEAAACPDGAEETSAAPEETLDGGCILKSDYLPESVGRGRCQEEKKAAESAAEGDDHAETAGRGGPVLAEAAGSALEGGGCAETAGLRHPEEIPVRKLELGCAGDRVLTPDHPEAVITVKILPEGAADRKVEWQVTNPAAIQIPYAKLEPAGENAVVLSAVGDGGLMVRCLSRSGTGQVRLISQLDFRAEGFGKGRKNPYEYISGGLMDYSNGRTGNGNEKGVSTALDGETVFGYEGLDFGLAGSDEVRLDIFGLSGDPYDIDIWDGVPGEEGSSRIDRVVYQKPPIWNVYQPETYHLPRKLTGVHTLCFAVRAKLHFRGFVFRESQRAFERLYAGEADAIYGDSFTREGSRVLEIGNNVSLVFSGLDFGETGTGRVVISGYSRHEIDTVNLIFSGGGEEERQAVEFVNQPDSREQSFALSTVRGKKEVTVVFLPGSCFDLDWIRFEPEKK